MLYPSCSSRGHFTSTGNKTVMMASENLGQDNYIVICYLQNILKKELRFPNKWCVCLCRKMRTLYYMFQQAILSIFFLKIASLSEKKKTGWSYSHLLVAQEKLTRARASLRKGYCHERSKWFKWSLDNDYCFNYITNPV